MNKLTFQFHIIVCLIQFLVIANIHSQSPTIEWQNNIGGAVGESDPSILKTNDNGYLVCGTSNSPDSCDKTEMVYGPEFFGQHNYDIWLLKLDSNGTIISQNVIAGDLDEYLPSIVPSNDGGYLIGCSSTSNNSVDKSGNSRGGNDFWIIKIDSNLNIVWEKTIGGSADDFLVDIIPLNDGYILGGQSNSNASFEKSENSVGYSDYWIIKVDLNGNIVWQNTIGGNNIEFFTKLCKGDANNIFVGGYSMSPISGDKTENNYSSFSRNFWVLNLNDSTGSIQWDKTYLISEIDILSDMIHINSELILGGTTQSIGGNSPVLIKVNVLNGLPTWQYIYTGWDSKKLDVLSYDQNNNVYFSGIIGNTIAPPFADYYVMKLNPNLDSIWYVQYGGTGTDDLVDMYVSANEIVLSGISSSGVSGDKTEPVCGNTDYWVINLSNTNSHLNTESLNNQSSINIFPNPFIDQINVQTIDYCSAVTLLNIHGEVLYYSMIDKDHTTIPAQSLSPGIYFIKVQNGQETWIRKVIKY